ncbi:MAG: DUF1800 family protein [Pseudomonadota bacterium]
MRLTSVLAALAAALLSLTTAHSAEAQPTREEAIRFLLQASFGPTEPEIQAVQRLGYGGWIEQQFALPGQKASSRLAAHEVAGANVRNIHYRDYFWDQAIYGRDQLRMRTLFALSQIVVVSVDEVKFIAPAYTNYVDLLHEESFGNYGDLIRRVTMLPVMADYLTYFRNRKANPVTGQQPDENYAREVMQLFTIGLEELALDGTSLGDETYTSADVEGLARVFTGFAMDGRSFRDGRLRKHNGGELLKGYPGVHEPGPKTFLGTTIPGGLAPEESVSRALDHLLAHRNVAPFISKLLIQKFVTSNPSPDYVRRVATVFNEGRYTMPSGTEVGDGKRGAMEPVLAAILLDREARDERVAQDPKYGKVREPVLRIAQVIRTIVDPNALPSVDGKLPHYRHLSRDNDVHNQTVFSPPSVFGFYRPGYVAAGTQTAEKGLVAPEMQVLTSDQIIGQARFYTILFRPKTIAYLDRDDARLMQLAQRPDTLVEALGEVLTPGGIDPEVRRRIEQAVGEIELRGRPEQNRPRLLRRALIATMMLSTTPEFVVQR